MSSPRSLRMSSLLASSSWRPSKTTSPLMRESRLRVRPITVRLETDLPEPDSPTMPRVRPGSSE